MKVKIKHSFVLLLLVLLVVLLNACSKDPLIKQELPANDIRVIVPPGWPQPHYDFAKNPLTTPGFILGRKLFYETKLSKDNTISCGSCHQQFAAFSHLDHIVSHGINGLLGTRNAPALANLIWQSNFMWDGGINHIEVQPIAPINNPVEMDETLANVIVKLQNDNTYPAMFKAAFGTETINSQLMLKAMTQFMGLLQSYNSKYDLYTRGQASLTASETNGKNLFQQKCASCHPAPLFTNFNYINNGLDTVFADAGRATITGFAADSGTFKVPSLRNVALTRPYMHDGRFETLQQVLEHYSSGIHLSSTLSPLLASGIPLSLQEKQDIISFLNTLTDNVFINDKRFNDPFF